MLPVCIQGIGVLGPGLSDWPSTVRVLTGELPYQPEPTVLPVPCALPSAERRRAGRVTKLALAVGAEAVAQAGLDARSLPSVFSSSGGDGEVCHEICLALASSERMISPTRFHNSVHNAAAGYWSIAHECAEASVSLCAHDASFGAGLLEAISQIARGSGALLLVAYDADYPQPLRARRPIPEAFGAGLLLAPAGASAALATLSIELCQDAPTKLEGAELEALRSSIPAARVLPLLQRLAQSRRGRVVLDYLDTARLSVEIEL
jgi:Beta-ketoacyl synthase, N-terminal domain